jgi:argininosuccinate lyase
LDDLLTLHRAFEADVAEVWSFEQSVERRDVPGGTSRRAVEEQIARLRGWLDQPPAAPPA